VLAVDDIDFIDGSSRNAFADVMREPLAVPALVVPTYAPAALPTAAPLDGESWSLAPLPPETFARLLPARILAQPRPLAPLTVEQLLAWARESRESPPDRLAELIARRAERMPPDAGHVLHALAVWGDDATVTDLSRLLPPGLDVGGALARLERAD